MKIVYSEKTLLHDPKDEVNKELRDMVECPQRVINILDALDIHRPRFNHQIVGPDDSIDYDKVITEVHKVDYLDYIQNIHQRWKTGGGGQYVSHFKNVSKNVSSDVKEKVRMYSDSSTCVMGETFEAAYASAQCAITGAKLLLESFDNKGVFALCRPPGHHCGSGRAAGFCYLNNAALATTYLKDALSDDENAHISILDLDFHHGNGTQEIFWKDANPAYVSLHATDGYPYTGLENEVGDNEGTGFTKNFQLPYDTGDEVYLKTLEKAIEHIKKYKSTHLVISFGVDTYKEDPVGLFLLTSNAYFRMGKIISEGLNIPTLVIMEGGYHLPTIGRNVDLFLTGLEGM